MTLPIINANSDDFAKLWFNLVGEPLEVSRQRGIDAHERAKSADAEYSEVMRLRTAEIIAGIRAKREQLTETVGDPLLKRRAA